MSERVGVSRARPGKLSFVEWYGGFLGQDPANVGWADAYRAYLASDDGDRDGSGAAPFISGVDLCRIGYDRAVAGGDGNGDGVVSEGDSDVGHGRALLFGEATRVDFDRTEGGSVKIDCSRSGSRGRLGVRSSCGDIVCESGIDVGLRFGRGGHGERVCDVVSESVACDAGPVDVEADPKGGSAGAFGCVRGKHYESNKKKRELRKARAKKARMEGSWRASSVCSDGDVDQNVPTLAEFISAKIDEEFVDSRALEVEMRVAERVALQKAKKTLAEKWAVENELAAARAKRSLEVLMAQDVKTEIKRQSTYLRLQTEKNMVGMEKAHQFLKKTGNVPGFAQTVLSDEGLTDGSSASPASPGECTISPDSSASMKEFREIVKQKADLEAKLDKICKMTKVSLEDLDDYDKNTWSLKSENYEKLDRMYPGGYILDPVPDYVDYDPPTHGYLKF